MWLNSVKNIRSPDDTVALSDLVTALRYSGYFFTWTLPGSVASGNPSAKEASPSAGFGSTLDDAGLGSARVSLGGSKTVSMTWMTPLLVTTSVLVILALPTMTLPHLTWIATGFPWTVLMLFPSSFTTSAAMTLPATTW